MIQTLMALLAMMLAILLTFNQQQSILNVERAMVRQELSAQATSVAVDRLEEIGAMPFDRYTVGETRVTSASGLTAAADFRVAVPPGDLDDFHTADVVQSRLMWSDTLRFKVLSYVSYADEANPAVEVSGVRTKFKKVRVVVYSLDQENPDTVRLAQSFACGSLCDW